MKKDALLPQIATLEGLPVELQLIFLHNIPDVASSRAVVYASPLCHQAYVSQRHSILSDVLLNELGSDMLFDALTIAKLSEIGRNSDIEDDETRRFLETYKLSREERSPALEILTPERVTRVAQLQRSVHFAAEDLCKWAIPKYTITGKRIKKHAPLSTSESRRVLRALY